MIRPELMTLFQISLHKELIPSFLNEILKYPNFQVKDNQKQIKSKKTKRQKTVISEEQEFIEQKVASIEENLSYIFSKLEIDPDTILPNSQEYKIRFEVTDVKDLIDKLFEETDAEKRRLKGFISNLEKYEAKSVYDEKFFQLLIWLKIYNVNQLILKSFQYFQVNFFFTTQTNFEEFQLNIDNEELPIVIQHIVLPSKDVAFFVIFHKSHQKDMDSIYKTIKCEKIENLEDFLTKDGVNIQKIEEELNFDTERIVRSKEFIETAKEKHYLYRAYLELLENVRKLIQIEEKFKINIQNQIVRIEAYVPTINQEEIQQNLTKKFKNQIRINVLNLSRDQESSKELNSEESQGSADDTQKTKVPSFIRTSKLLKPFKMLVDLYGTPNYQEIDPTFMVAITYPIIFGLMFGDVGQGLVLIIIGSLLALFIKKKPEKKLRDFGFFFIWLGIGACIGGLIYGEFFGNELMINGKQFVLLASPLTNIVVILKFVILVGVVHLNLGWVLSIINNILQKRIYFAFTNPFLKIVLLTGGTYLIFTYKFEIFTWLAPPYPILLAIIPAALIIIFSWIGKKIFRISYLQEGSIGETTMDVGETYLAIISNVASYSRLLALTMAHIGLMLIFSTLAKMSGSNIIVITIILIFGNGFVMLLEGFLAAINSLRLHFYEFFSKFYVADGIRYNPIKINNDYSEIRFTEHEKTVKT